MIMKVKLRSILAGKIPRDADYTRLIALVPDVIDDSNRHLTYYAKNSVPAWEIQLLSHIRNAAKKSQVDEMTKKVPVDTVKEMRFRVDAENIEEFADADTDTDEEKGGEDEDGDEDGDEDEDEDEDEEEDEDGHEDMEIDMDVDEDGDDDDDEDHDDDEDDSSSNSDTCSDQDTDPDAEIDADAESVATFVGAAVQSRVSEAMEELEKAGLEAARKGS